MIAARQTLISAGETWGADVYRDLAPAGTTRPFVVMTFVGGGTSYESQGRPENVRMRFICVGASQAQADEAADAVEALLTQQGSQQKGGGALNASVYGWDITSARKGDSFFPAVELDEGREIYRAGLDIDFKCVRSA